VRLHVLFLSAALIAAAAEFPEADFPAAEISSKNITAKLYLPDAERGYYRGTRFDWSGQIYSLKVGAHEYFGQWFPKYDPKLHDSIMGPVEEFRSEDGGVGYAEAQPGGTFVRIGVGVVRKPDNKPFEPFKTYDIVDSGRWALKHGRDWIEFQQELRDPNGYSYRYTKTIRLAKPGMVIEHRLKNTGKKVIKTWQYNHNFFMLDHAATGPASLVQFPFELKPVEPLRGSAGEVRGRNIVYTRELEPGGGDSVFGVFTGFGNTASDYDFQLENKKAGIGVEIIGDQPIARLVFWSIRTTFCPEAYININVKPGKEFKWRYKYRFYELGK
jgi:hypothetical protein